MYSLTSFQRTSTKFLLAGAAALSTSSVLSGNNENATTTSCRSSTKLSKDRRTQKIVIVGGGTAGVGVAAMLQNEGMSNVTIIEPKSVHYYQPLWTLVGGGTKSNSDSVKPMSDIVPKGANWMQESVETFSPKDNQVNLDDGTSVEYDYLVVAAGIQSDWDKIPGLVDGLKKEGSGVVSIYDYNYCNKTWREFQSIKNKPGSTKMIFTIPATPIKCAGAPQKIMWLLEDDLRRDGLRDKASVQFWVPGASMFGVKYYADKLDKIRTDRGVEAAFRRELVSLDVDKKEATFKNLESAGKDEIFVKQSYDLIHVAPPMSAPDFIKKSPLANDKGWVEVDKHTLQSPKFDNVFGLGDCTSTPNSKTAAAVTAQAPVLVHNIQRKINGEPLDGRYNGYASCPLILGKGKAMLAEFGYGGKLMETFSRETGNFPFNLVGTEGAVQQRFFYFLKEQLFPFVYWNMWIRGWWYGTHGCFKPNVIDKNETSSNNKDAKKLK